MKAIYNYKNEFYEFMGEIEDHLVTKSEYGDNLIIDCRNIRLNGVKIPNADCIYIGGNVTKVGIRTTNDVVEGKNHAKIGEAQYIEPLAELWTTTDGMRLRDLRFERQIGTTDKYRSYHYILE